MKRITVTVFILALGAWMATEPLNAATSSNTSVMESAKVQQHPRRERPPHRSPIMNKEDFRFLYNIIKGKAFDKDRLELLSVGVLDNYFSCRQCVKLMSIYTFDDDKLKVLNIMTGHIADLENAQLILDAFSFDSNKRKAASLLRVRRR